MMMTLPSRSAKSLLIQLGRAELLPLRSFRDETSLMEHIRRDWTLYELHDFSMTIEPPGFFCDYPADYPPPKSGMSIVAEGDRLHFVYATPDLKGKLKSIIADLLAEADKAKKDLSALAKDGDGAAYDGHFYYDDHKMNTMSIDEIKRAVELVKRWDTSGNIAAIIQGQSALEKGQADLKRGQDDLYAQGEGIRSDTIGMTGKLDTLTDKANETQAAANLAAKHTKDISTLTDKAGKIVNAAHNAVSAAQCVLDKHTHIRGAQRRIEDKLDTIEKTVANIDHTCNGTAANVAEVLTNTPSLEMMQRLETLAHAGKKPETAISQPTAVEIFNLLLPHKTITQQTLSNWLKRGKCPKARSFPIAQTDLASKPAFVTWVQNYATAAGTQTVQLTKEIWAIIQAL